MEFRHKMRPIPHLHEIPMHQFPPIWEVNNCYETKAARRMVDINRN